MRLQILICTAATILAAACSRPEEKSGLLQDFDYFFEQLECVHPDPYTAFGGEKSFHRSVGELRKELEHCDALDADELQVRISEFLVPLHDGHTWCGHRSIAQGDTLYALPFSFRPTKDDLFMWVATDEYSGLLGSVLKSIEGVDVDELLDRLAVCVSSENRYGLLDVVRNTQFNTEYLKFLLDSFDHNSVAVGLRMPDGADTTVTVRMLDMDEVHSKSTKAVSADNRFPSGNFEYKWADRDKVVMAFRCTHVISRDCLEYMRDRGMEYQSALDWAWNGKSIEDVPAIAECFGSMLQEMKDAGAQHLIIDLRSNGGGWSPIVFATLYQLYGDEFLSKDLGAHYESRISELYLKKNNTTLEEFNAANGTNLKIGDYTNRGIEEGASMVIDDEIRKSMIDGYICMDKDMLYAQGGKPLYKPEHIYVVTDTGTFSAAFHYAFMLWRMGATVVGVPSSQAPNTFMESTPFTLPNSGIDCSISNALQIFLPEDDPRAKVFWPDWMLTYDDYRRLNFDSRAELIYILETATK